MKISRSFPAVLAAFAFTPLTCPAQSPRAEPIEDPAIPTPQASPQTPENIVLQTRVFRVPPEFPGKGIPPAPDPLAQPSANSPAPKASASEVLKSLGIVFPPGAAATYSADTSRLVVRNTLAQLDAVEAVVDAMFGENTITQQGLVHVEIFSLPPLSARKALMDHPKEAALYAWLEAASAVPDGSVKLEHHSITTVRGGQKARTDGIEEIAAPTEFSRPQIPQNISLPVAAPGTPASAGDAVFPAWPRGAATPVGHTFHDAGHVFEVELTFGEKGRTVDLNVAPQNTRRAGIVKWGIMGELYQPVFEIQRCSAQVSGLVDQPILVSTFSPPINTGVPGGNQVDRTWLLFVTVKKPG